MFRIPIRIVGALLIAPFPLVAQDAPQSRHSGFHAAVGLGSGSAALTCSSCSSDRETSSATMIRFGGAVSPTVVLSGEINGWAQDKGGVKSTLSFVNVVAQFYSEPTSKFFFKAGVGLAAGAQSISGLKLETNSYGLIAGIGYDIGLTPGFALTPYVDYAWMASADAKLNGSGTGVSVGANLLHFGLAASWR
jgi:hypothetical protein